MNAHTWFRVPAATLLGSAVTLVVFLLMQGLIARESLEVQHRPAAGELSFVRVIEPTPPAVRERKPVRPQDPITPPLIDVIPPRDGSGEPTEVAFLPPDAGNPELPAIDAMTDGDALPIVKVQPVYPRHALARNLEGYVLVEFTIDALGRVVDVRVIEASPPGVFERAALQAAQRFRYKPRVVNGQPTPVTGVRHLLTFELASG